MDARAKLVASYDNFDASQTRANPGCYANENWYYYDLTITETSGLSSATLESRKRCYYSENLEWCDELRTTMPGGLGENVFISAGNSIIMKDRWFCLIRGYTYNTTETFYEDNVGTNQLVEYSINNIIA